MPYSESTVQSSEGKSGKVYFFKVPGSYNIGQEVEVNGKMPMAFAVVMREGGYLSLAWNKERNTYTLYSWHPDSHFSILVDCYGTDVFPIEKGKKSYFFDNEENKART